MAQDQRVEFLFAAQVTGQNELSRLTAAVDKLRQETDQLRGANAGLAASTEAVVRGNTRYNNAIDAQSKALRNARQGTQQLGMQVNDFVTSVSTGASPIQAFNQQIGQVGFALSMMDGKLGAVGRFLAGPWSIVILGATMLLGQFTKSTDESAKASANFGDYALASFLLVSEKIETGLIPAIEGIKPALKTLEPVIQGVAVFFSNLLEVGKQMANGLIRVFVMAVNTIAILAGNSFKMVGELAIGTINAGIIGINKLISDVEGRINQMAGYANQFMSFLGVSFRFGEARFGRLEMVTNKWAGSTQQAFSDVADAARKTLGMDFLPSAGEVSDRANELFLGRQKPDKKKKGGSDASGKDKDKKDQIEANKALQEYLKMLQTGAPALTAYQDGVYGLQQAYGALTPELQKQYAAQQEAALLQQDMLQIARDEKALKDSLDGGLLPAIAALADKPTAAMDGIIARGEEMRSAFENIGNTVSDAFQGMLTGATSFKDGMKSIISSVISELWRLYVVQQIVGFFTGTVMPAAQSVFKGKALGGSVGKNQPYMVGERGPELFIPGGSGTIIPNRNLGSGGGGNAISINVDARGSADPAAVRAQVQQGILEAAPAIIAAAEARTVNGLRRPRLGGVMQ